MFNEKKVMIIADLLEKKMDSVVDWFTNTGTVST